MDAPDNNILQNLSESDQKIFQAWLLALLKSQMVQVTFKKASGDVRVMKATLNPSLLPEKSQVVESLPGKAAPETACRVFDTEKQQWRSFRWDSVVSVEVDLA
jgi:hypothetical protein